MRARIRVGVDEGGVGGVDRAREVGISALLITRESTPVLHRSLLDVATAKRPLMDIKGTESAPRAPRLLERDRMGQQYPQVIRPRENGPENGS